MADEEFVDYYELLGVEYNSTEKEIAKAYRQKSLKCHPDKVGSDNVEAVELFHKLSKGYDILRDPVAKLDYDKKIKERAAKKAQLQAMDSKRRKVREDLETREAAAKKQKQEQAAEQARRTAEVYSLREQGIRKIREQEEEQRRKAQEAASVAAAASAASSSGGLDAALSVKWKKKKHTFNVGELRELFGKYGEVDEVHMKVPGKALVLFKSVVTADTVLQNKSLDRLKVFEINWATGHPPSSLAHLLQTTSASIPTPPTSSSQPHPFSAPHSQPPPSKSSSASTTTPIPQTSFPSFSFSFTGGGSGFGTGSGAQSAADYESLTLLRMRQAAERARLKAEMASEGKGQEGKEAGDAGK
ncbi:hypothetical protein HK102_013186 [Quaeritorhiza haematococci]|nr:hypothetical protein HK102_013186 [Quaeritorhiza haematococci]